MFLLLRRLVILICLAGVLCVGVIAYQNRHALDPLADLWNAARIRLEGSGREPESLSGEVIKVIGEYSIQLRSDSERLYNLQLTGFEPISGTDAAERKLQDESRIRLSQLVLSNHVRVDATYLNEQRTGLGVVYASGTNVNAALVEAGLARMNRKYLKDLSVRQLYEMMRAERIAKREKRGLWSE